MPDFSAHRQRKPNPHKPAKRGEQTEASMKEMRETKRRLRDQIRQEVLQEEAAKANDRSPQPKVHARPTGARVWA